MKILVTARDIGATLHILEIVRYIKQEGSNEVIVYAQNPAVPYFNRENIACELVDFKPAKSSKDEIAKALIEHAHSIINNEKPDVILSGLTTPFDIGIDEAVVYVAKERIPTFVMQDFWGVVNDRLGVLADYYFCLDQLASELTQLKYNVKTIVLGAPKYIRYADLDVAHNKKEMRYNYNIEHELVIGYFGQALHHMHGYSETLTYFLRTLSHLKVSFLLIYKPHPRENKNDIEATLKIIKKFNINFLIYNQIASSEALLMCDIVCSPFSNCSYDAAFLNYYSDCPQILPINLLYNEEVRDYCFNVTHLNETPYMQLGLAKNIECKENLSLVLNNQNYLLQKVWSSSKQLQNPEASVKNALAAMLYGLSEWTISNGIKDINLL